MKIDSFPVQGIADWATRDAVDRLQRSLQAIAGDKGLATKDDVEALKRLIQSQQSKPATVVKQTVTNTTTADGLPVVSGTYDEIWTLAATPTATPASFVVQNDSPGLTSAVDPVGGSAGSPLDFAQINIVGTYVYPAADMNLGFGGFLNFITRNLDGDPIQGAFVNGGLIGTNPTAERGDLDLGIYGPNIAGSGDNAPRIIALRAQSDGSLELAVDSDNVWNLGSQPGRWGSGYFGGLVQCAGVDVRYNPLNPFVMAIGNPSSAITAGPYGTLAGYMTYYWNTTPVYVPCYVAP